MWIGNDTVIDTIQKHYKHSEKPIYNLFIKSFCRSASIVSRPIGQVLANLLVKCHSVCQSLSLVSISRISLGLPIKHTLNQSSNQPVNGHVNQAISKASMNQSVKQSVSRSNNQENKSINFNSTSSLWHSKRILSNSNLTVAAT